MSFRTLAAALIILLAACESVPDLRFVESDATADGAGASDSGDGGSSPIDAALEASTDAEADASGCAAPAPADARCCAGRWCVNCDDAKCLECQAEGCKLGELCCGKNQKVQCKAQCP